MRYEKFITRKMLQDNPNTLFVFGDNLLHKGMAGQAKEMRGEQNAVGIPTKAYPGMGEADFFNDEDDFVLATSQISKQFIKLFNHARGGGDIVWPEDGIGTGLADLKNKAPKIWHFIEAQKAALEQIK